MFTHSFQVIFPRKAQNLNNEWVFVVNIDNFTQAVEIEECEAGAFSSSIPTQLNTFGYIKTMKKCL